MAITPTTLTKAAGLAAVGAGLTFIGVQIGHPHLDAESIGTTEMAVRTTAKLLMAMLAVVGLTPFDVRGLEGGVEGVLVLLLAVAIIVWLIVVSIMKGKCKLALLGAFIPLCALVAALRLARPESRWARRHYGPEKLARAKARTAWYDKRFGPATEWVSDFVAGRPSEPDPAS